MAKFTWKLAKMYFRIAAFDVPMRSFRLDKACLIITANLGWLLVLLALLLLLLVFFTAWLFAFLAADEPDCDV